MSLFMIKVRYESGDRDEHVFESENVETAKADAATWVQTMSKYFDFARVSIREFFAAPLMVDEPRLGPVEWVILDENTPKPKRPAFVSGCDEDATDSPLDNSPALIAEGVA